MSDAVEITLDLPMPPSANAIWRSGRGRTYSAKKYIDWQQHADITVMATKPPGRLQKIYGPFEAEILLSIKHRGDGDNRIKPLLDWLQSRDLVRNDSDCRRGSWRWVSPEEAPKGCRVIVRTLERVHR